jgi:hypothetical protein
VRTEYSALRPAVRSALRDPLILRLVADIYRDRPIPDYIQVNDLYKYYIDNLITSKQLHHTDLILLEQELMPLMLGTGVYENKLTAAQIETARTSDGRPMWELIHSSDSLGGGQRVNDSYVRLRDTELLNESGAGMDYIINFKYERFYEFFAAHRISNLSHTEPDLTAFYIDLIERLSTAPYLRNSIKSLLLDAATSDNLTLILELCFTPHRPVARMMIDTLSELGKYRLDVLERVLSQLIPPEKKSTFLEKVKKVLNKSTSTNEISRRNAKKIAIQVAGNLGVPWVLFYRLSENTSELGQHPRI